MVENTYFHLPRKTESIKFKCQHFNTHAVQDAAFRNSPDAPSDLQTEAEI